MRITIGKTLVAAAALLLLAGAQPAPAQVTDDNLVQQLQSAKTPAEHQALADFFNAKAAAAAANVTKHEAMLKATQRGSEDVWRQHCGNLIKTFRAEEADYRALAKQQEKLAKAGPH